MGALQSILHDGIRTMDRAAIHFVSNPMTGRKSLYLTSKKAPYVLVADGNRAASEGKHAFSQSLNDITLSDGDTLEQLPGRAEQNFIVALYAQVRFSGTLSYRRLDLDSARNGDVPIKNFPGLSDDEIFPPEVLNSRAPHSDVTLKRSFVTLGGNSRSRERSSGSAQDKLPVSPLPKSALRRPNALVFP